MEDDRSSRKGNAGAGGQTTVGVAEIEGWAPTALTGRVARSAMVVRVIGIPKQTRRALLEHPQDANRIA